ncbi:POTRA domain-containing protein [Lutimonas zeaxanthinifaciens]|uniref:POTRA domain-containing protein n=1 Tax=Lutimonas zeaxanthinifaciens TaxID=3060215 RepID=UPI00265D0D8C|nr:POTRA domain-containing protein [Lutimonas sp. YSD2104]WKK66784.1 POTRA domain-containing protein [Lutimonas sp. YSD2104]
MLRKLTPYIYILFFCASVNLVFSQDKRLQIVINETEITDLNILKEESFNAIDQDSVQQILQAYKYKMALQGYLRPAIDSIIPRDSLISAYISPGKKVEVINIDFTELSRSELLEKELRALIKNPYDSLIRIPVKELPDLMNSLVDLFESKGNSFVHIRLDHIELLGGEAYAKLKLDLNQLRRIDKVIVKGYENFPRNYLNYELGLKEGEVFNRDKINNASKAVNNLSFAQEMKPPEVLFTNDSTIVYLYLKKKKSNQFDGIIGFASKEEGDGIFFNGYLDLSVNNIFNAGETIALFWKSNGNERQRFFLEANLPFLFNLPITPKVNFEIYRQDSTFSNVKTKVNLAYATRNIGSIEGIFETENSSDLSNGLSSGIDSFSNLFFGLSYEYNLLASDELFPVNFHLDLTALAGSRKNEGSSTSQTKFGLEAYYLYSIDPKNHIFLRNVSGLLISEDYFENELFRIGGIYNLRGVNEESIFASSFTIFNLEYRFKPNAGSYFYSITDFSYSENKLADLNTNVISLGFGYAFQTKSGLLNLSYALGKFDNEPIRLDNSKIHVKIVTKF